MKANLLLGAALVVAVPGTALAQPETGHAGHEATAPSSEGPDPLAGHAPALEPASTPDMEGMSHAGHDMTGMDAMSPGEPQAGTAPAPAPPDDHAADALFDPAEMARAREALLREVGGFSGSMVLFDLAEFQARAGRNGYRWEGEAWFGGDIDRLLIKSEGEGAFGEAVGDVEIQALWSHAVSPFWNAHVGVRHDIVPNPSRTYAVIGIEGIAPYWFHLTGQAFLSDKGDVRARIEGSYDERITQRLILQPRVELNLSAQDMPAIGVGAGLSDFELGARLRYEIRREFAPYVGVEWSTKTGETARLSRLAGEDPDAINFVAGVRFWF